MADMKKPNFNIPPPELQVAFSELLSTTEGLFLQRALLETVKECDIVTLDQEAHQYVPDECLSKLAGCGLRAEQVFALPTVLRSNPRLLGYYRLLLGFSRKEFYDSKKSGLNRACYKNMEEKGLLVDEADANIPCLCQALNVSAAYLIERIPEDRITLKHLEHLTLLTYGAQLRGSHNVAIGQHAVKQVFEIIKDIVGPSADVVEDNLISLTDATGRKINIRFSSDPDIEIVTVAQGKRSDTPVLAIEVKGGRDRSNVHNRLGEAEKSHLKAKQRGFTDLWTITNVDDLSEDARKAASPTTTAFFNLEDLRSGKGPGYEDFRERLLQKLRLPDS